MSRAKRQDVAILALTDHDTLAGVARARRQAELEGLDFVSGIEFSSRWQGVNIHLVGLNIDLEAAVLQCAVRRQVRRRQERARLIAGKLEAVGLKNCLHGAQALAGDAVIGRPHFASYLVAQGHCRNIQQAFKRYLGAGKAGDVKQVWPAFDEVIAAIRAAGGVAVLAHPHKYSLTRTKLCSLVADFKAAGGLALEVVSGVQQARVTRDLATIATQYELLASCGSDFHMPGNDWQELGRFSPLPDDVVPVWTAWAAGSDKRQQKG